MNISKIDYYAYKYLILRQIFKIKHNFYDFVNIIKKLKLI